MNYPNELFLPVLFLLALLANVPLGFLREKSPRFSPRWFVYIHLPIPFLAYLRISAGLGWTVIPPVLVCSVAGQMLGGKIYRRRR